MLKERLPKATLTALESVEELHEMEGPFRRCMAAGGHPAGAVWALLLRHTALTLELMEASWLVDDAKV